MSGTFAPRINHLAISVDADVLNDEGRSALLGFYSEVFGWTEGDNSTEKGNPLILYTGSLGQFLYLLPAKDQFMVTPNMDHDRVRITDVGTMVTHYGDRAYTLTNVYVWFLIPLWIELQHIERRSED
jgi:hypothetical protein